MNGFEARCHFHGCSINSNQEQLVRLTFIDPSYSMEHPRDDYFCAVHHAALASKHKVEVLDKTNFKVPPDHNRRIFSRELMAQVHTPKHCRHPATDTYPITFLQRGNACLGAPMKNGNGSTYGNMHEPYPMKSPHRNVYATFGGERYDDTIALILGKYATFKEHGKNIPCGGAKHFGADSVFVYDDKWLIEQTDFTRKYDYLFGEKSHGFGWFAWKPFIILDALDRCNDGDVVLYTDADTFPISELTPLYDQCRREGGIMLFGACGLSNRHWTKRDCNILMGMDSDEWRDKPAAVARFMLFEKSKRSIEFLNTWLKFATNLHATTFDDSRLAPEYPDCIQHRCEQSILTNLAHKWEIPLHREACEAGLGHVLKEHIRPKTPPVLGVMPKTISIQSVPRFGPLDTQHCITLCCAAVGIKPAKHHGAWWEQGVQNLFEDAIKDGYEYVITFDYDSMFEPEDLGKMLQRIYHDPSIDILSCVQGKREEEQMMVNIDREKMQSGVEKKIDILEPMPILSAHFGMTVIRLAAIKDVPKPWFLNVPNEKGEWREGMIAADMYFWNKMHKHGVHSFILPCVSIGHTEVVVKKFNIATGKCEYKYIHEWNKKDATILEIG